MEIDLMVIRPLAAGDELAIAEVHIRTWQESYKGILPQDYLDGLSAKISERVRMWKNITENPNRWCWVAEGPTGIVGFILFGPPRDPGKEGYIELGAIYLLNSAKGKGTGFSLLATGFNHMKSLGYEKAYCWVLEKNPTTRFYESTGAKTNGQTKVEVTGGISLNELAYEWSSLDLEKRS